MKVVLPELVGGKGEAMLMKWFPAEGDLVKEGDPLYELEYRKIVSTKRSPATGRFHKIVAVGDMVKPGQEIAEIVEE